jgi:hypothetical protein
MMVRALRVSSCARACARIALVSAETAGDSAGIIADYRALTRELLLHSLSV